MRGRSQTTGRSGLIWHVRWGTQERFLWKLSCEGNEWKGSVVKGAEDQTRLFLGYRNNWACLENAEQDCQWKDLTRWESQDGTQGPGRDCPWQEGLPFWHCVQSGHRWRISPFLCEAGRSHCTTFSYTPGPCCWEGPGSSSALVVHFIGTHQDPSLPCCQWRERIPCLPFPGLLFLWSVKGFQKSLFSKQCGTKWVVEWLTQSVAHKVIDGCHKVIKFSVTINTRCK